MSSTDSHLSFKFVNAPQVIGIGTALPVACIIMVLIRFVTRARSKRGLGWDDWLILFALTNVIGMGIAVTVGAALHAMGYPTPKIPAGLTTAQAFRYQSQATVIVEKVQFIFQMLMILAYGSVKISITLFYRQLFVTGPGTIFDILSKSTLVILSLWTLTFELIMILDCGSHVKANWQNDIEQSKYCRLLYFSSEYGMAISDLMLDLFVILMPMPLIWTLNLPWTKKLAVTGTFLLGASAIGASIARLIFYLEILGAADQHISIDGNEEVAAAMYWSLLEAGLAVIAACLPTLPLLNRSRGLRATFHNVAAHLSFRPEHKEPFQPQQQESLSSAQTLAESYPSRVRSRSMSASNVDFFNIMVEKNMAVALPLPPKSVYPKLNRTEENIRIEYIP